MRTDHQLQKAVLEQLDFDPSVDASHLGVFVHEGVVTLTGHVASFGEKRAAEIAAGLVKGVKAVVDEINVELPGHCQSPDEVVAERAYARLASNMTVPVERIHLSVAGGVVTLRGDVDWQFQRRAAEQDLQKLDCIKAIHNDIAVKPPLNVSVAKERVRAALARIAPLDADKIDVAIAGNCITLSGMVNSWHEKDLAECAAWSIPGVTAVSNHVQVV